MSLFSTILEKLGLGANAQAAPATPPPSPGTAAAEAAPPPTPMSSVDVVSKLEGLARTHKDKEKEDLNWRTSIVDLLKLLDIDSSLTARKTLAGELGYKDSTDDSAHMNQWLHRTVMEKLAENGGNVPNDLRA
jgi:hypothetical protein